MISLNDREGSSPLHWQGLSSDVQDILFRALAYKLIYTRKPSWIAGHVLYHLITPLIPPCKVTKKEQGSGGAMV